MAGRVRDVRSPEKGRRRRQVLACFQEVLMVQPFELSNTRVVDRLDELPRLLRSDSRATPSSTRVCR